MGLRYTGDADKRFDRTLADWANRCAAQASGLLEPLVVIEIDIARNEALLRSGPPTSNDGRVSYYELMLLGVNGMHFRRYVATLDGDEHREQVPYALTNEVLAKFITDVAGTR
jgi:hypothetical protein